jgi:hypothetical protein
MGDVAAVSAQTSLYELFLQTEDPRDPHGVRHPLAALLTLAATAMLAGAKTLTDIAAFGRHRKKLRKAIGFTRGKSPCIGTFHYLFKVLDAQKFESTLQTWLQQSHAVQGGALHIDGKTLKGSRQGEIPGVHLLAAYSQTLGTALIQLPVDAKTNEHKAALELLKVIPLKGALVTGDAAFTQRDFSQAVLDGDGDYLLMVKENQPSLRQAILDAFDAPFSPGGESGAGTRSADGHHAG